MNEPSFIDPCLLEEFDNHSLVNFIYGKKGELCGYIVIHRLRGKFPSFGATRFWNYSAGKEALKDALRLSKAMSYKAALAGLPGGGAKAVLIDSNLSILKRNDTFQEYARQVNYLNGLFVTGSDVGLTKEDVKKMRRISPYFVGTKVNPEKFTALGLFYSIKVALKHVYGDDAIYKRSFAIQGVGKVGAELLELLYKYTNNIYISDIDIHKIKLVKRKYPKVKVVNPNLIHKKKVDVFSPCALSGCINIGNIHEIGCKIILGGANNQLENKSIASLLNKVGILYSPDFVVNAGGLISVYDEYENKTISFKRLRKKIENIGSTLEVIFGEANKKNKPPSKVAEKMAEKIFNGEK